MRFTANEIKRMAKKKSNIATKWTSPFTLSLLIGLSLISLIFIVLILWGLSTSVKTIDDFMNNKVWLPSGNIFQWAWDNYLTAFSVFKVKLVTAAGTRYVYIEEMLLNSFLYAVVGAFIQTFSVCWVAYLTQRYRYKFSEFIYVAVIVVMIVPSLNSQASLLKIARFLNVYDTMFSFYFMKLSFTNMFYLVFFASFKTLPKDYDESAMVDGANDFIIFFKIMFPLASGAFLTVFLLNFMGYWNDYMTPLVFIPSKYTVAYGVYYLVTGASDNILSRTPMKMAICFLYSLPILVIYIIFRDKVMNNVNIGGIKE